MIRNLGRIAPYLGSGSGNTPKKAFEGSWYTLLRTERKEAGRVAQEEALSKGLEAGRALFMVS